MTRLTLRCSSLDRILKCPGSTKLPTVKIESSEAAQAGTDKHNKALADFLNDKGRSAYLDYIREPKSNYSGIEWQGSYHFKDFTLSGGVDYWRLLSGTLEIIDLKTGTYEVLPTSPQLRGYAFLLLKNLQMFDIDVLEVKITIFQFDVASSVTFTVAQILEFESYLVNRVESGGLVQGDHCTFCESKYKCPLVQADIETVLHPEALPDNGREVLKAATTIGKYLTQLKADYIKHNPDGVEYSFRSTKVWKDGVDVPHGGISVPQAIKLGVDVDGLWDSVKTKVAKIK